MSKINFDEIFQNDPLGLLEVEGVQTSREISIADQHLIDSFEEINEFYEENNREPQLGTDIGEFMLASRLQSIRNTAKKVKVLLPYDFYNLLRIEQSKAITVEDILGDDPLNLLNIDANDEGIFKLIHVKETDRIRPDFISRRNICKNFSDYECMFQSVHEDLKSGARKLIQFKEQDLKVGKFFVLRGILLFMEKSDDLAQEYIYESGSRVRNDGRTRCIFDNGTESDMLYRSLYKALLKDGFGVSDKEDKIIDSTSVEDSDVQNGYVYVLSSLSSNQDISKINNLYKIGCSTGTVTDRIKNASKEPTYLLSEVRVELTVRCYNINVFGLESIIHNFFGKVNVQFEVSDKEGNVHYPREWFIAPLSVIEEVITLIIDGKIKDYEYNSEMQLLVKKSSITSENCDFKERKEQMVAEPSNKYGE